MCVAIECLQYINAVTHDTQKTRLETRTEELVSFASITIEIGMRREINMCDIAALAGETRVIADGIRPERW